MQWIPTRWMSHMPDLKISAIHLCVTHLAVFCDLRFRAGIKLWDLSTYDWCNFSHIQSKICEVVPNNMCELMLLVCALSEMHESLSEEEEVEGAEFETLQDWGAVTVNVNKIHGVSTEYLISCFTSLWSCGGREWAQVTDPAETRFFSLGLKRVYRAWK